MSMNYNQTPAASVDTNVNNIREETNNDKLSSVYIPRVYGTISIGFISETFEMLNLGIVSHVQTVKRPGNDNSYMAFVYFKHWNTDNPAAVKLAKKVNDPKTRTQAKIIYDEPWYWILLPNTSANKIPQSLNTDEEYDILTMMVEDLQSRLLESEKKQKALENEMNTLRVIVSSHDAMFIPPPPKLVRQTACINKMLTKLDLSSDWWPAEEEMSIYHKERTKRRRMYDDNNNNNNINVVPNYTHTNIYNTPPKMNKVDRIGLVYPASDNTKDFWCGP